MDRLKHCPLPTDKKMKKSRRGTAVALLKKSDGVKLTAVKWIDNRSVTLLSTCAGVLPAKNVRRWDKKESKEITVPCPSVIAHYNASMGGVDLLDSLIALYRTTIRSKKCYHRIFFHLFDMAVVQSWLTYKVSTGLPSREAMSLLQFKQRIATCLTKQGKQIRGKRGRPSLEVETLLVKKKSRGPSQAVPEMEVRTDNVAHFPIPGEKKGRCKLPNCKGFSRITCEKCHVFLCLTAKSNCFRLFHRR